MNKNFCKRFSAAVFCFCAAIILAGSFAAPSHAQAAVKKAAVLSSGMDTSCRLDLDGDGSKEKLELKTSYDDDQAFFSMVRFEVDGREALSYQNMQITLVRADYVQLNDTDIFLRIYTTTDNDCVVTDRFYIYDPAKKKLVETTKLLAELCGILHAQAEIKNVDSTGITVAYQMQFDEIGRVKWDSRYTVKNETLKLKSNVMKVKSSMGDTMLDEDGYNSRFKKNQFQAMQKIRLYDRPDLKNVSFTAVKGDVLKLAKMKYTGKSLYAQFSKGNKTGWIKLGQDRLENPSGLFYGVAQRLAG